MKGGIHVARRVRDEGGATWMYNYNYRMVLHD